MANGGRLRSYDGRSDATRSGGSEAERVTAREVVRVPAGRWYWTATFTVSLVILVLAMAGLKGWRDLRSATERADELRSAIGSVEQSISTLNARIEELQSNDASLERVARQELGVVRPEEIVVILPVKSNGGP